MTTQQQIAWIRPCESIQQTINPVYAHKMKRDGVDWMIRLAVLRQTSAYPGSCWYAVIAGFNKKGDIVPVKNMITDQLLWNEARTKIAAAIADELFMGVGMRNPDGTPDIIVIAGDSAWHFYLPLTGAEAINVRKKL